MFHYLSRARAGAVVFALLLGGCATGTIKPVDKDIMERYEGHWTGTVGAPQATRVALPGNWFMRCAWQPFEIHLTVADGMAQLEHSIDKTPVSADGRFRFDVITAAAGMTGGVMQGNGKFVDRFEGRFADAGGRGIYSRYITSLGFHGCSTTIEFRRQSVPDPAVAGPVA